jgi:hypothetical protein
MLHLHAIAVWSLSPGAVEQALGREPLSIPFHFMITLYTPSVKTNVNNKRYYER